jgi:hypothetical protein
VVIPERNVILCKKTLRNFSVTGLAFAVILLQRLFEDRVIGLYCKNKMLKKRKSREKRSTTYTYQDTDFFQRGFDCDPQTLEITDPVMIRSKLERKFEIQTAASDLRVGLKLGGSI